MNLQAWCEYYNFHIDTSADERSPITVAVSHNHPGFRHLWTLEDYNIETRTTKGDSSIITLRPKPQKDALAIKHKKPKLDIGSVGAIFGRRLLGRSGRRRG